MKARLPEGFNQKGNNMQDILKQAQQMQQDMQDKQAELETREYTAVAGGNMVTAVVDGTKTVKSIKIAPEVVDPNDIEMLEDLVTAAVNEALSNAEKDAAKEMEAIQSQMPNIPGLF